MYILVPQNIHIAMNKSLGTLVIYQIIHLGVYLILNKFIEVYISIGNLILINFGSLGIYLTLINNKKVCNSFDNLLSLWFIMANWLCQFDYHWFWLIGYFFELEQWSNLYFIWQPNCKFATHMEKIPMFYLGCMGSFSNLKLSWQGM